MQPNLPRLLDQLGIPPKPRFSPEEAAGIIGIRRDQVLGLLKRGKLVGIRASERRWSGILADDLAAYLDEVNAPRIKPTKAMPIAEAPCPAIVLDAATTAPPAMRATETATAITPPVPLTPPMTDLSDEVPGDSTVDDPNFVSKYNLGF